MGEARHDGLAVPGRVVLAHEPPFQLGALSVDPPTRQVETAARRETLEPRVMQVLVLLARADRIVTRDELVERCWEGRIVSNDAINRVISRIRQVAADLGEGSFGVKTIARVGYRLVRTRQSAGGHPEPSRADRRRLMIGGAAAAIAALGIGGVWRGWPNELRVSNEARRLYGEAMTFGMTGLPEDNRKAIAHLKEAVRIAPDYADAWGALALAYTIAIGGEPAERVEGFELFRDEAIRHALRLDRANIYAIAAARLPANHFGQWAAAEETYRGLIARHPKFASITFELGSLFMDVGRWHDAARAFTHVKGANPPSPVTSYRLAVSLWGSGNIAAADDEIDGALKRWPQHPVLWQTRIKLLGLTGRPRAALAMLDDVTSRPIDADSDMEAGKRLLLEALVTGAKRDADRAVEAMLDAVYVVATDGVITAINCAALGLRELALDILEGAFLGIGRWAAPGPRDNRIATHPLFQPHARKLWSAPRFAALVERIGLESYWTRMKVVPDYRRAISSL